jgi:ArsR family transcriptional regulator, virulence genes transcriptional regulator
LLRKDGLVAPRRDAQTIYYRLANEQVVRLLETLHAIFCREDRAR